MTLELLQYQRDTFFNQGVPNVTILAFVHWLKGTPKTDNVLHAIHCGITASQETSW